MAKTITLGLMSGTSLDGVDVVAVDFDNSKIRLIGHHHVTFDETLHETLLSLCLPSDNEIDRAGKAAVELSRVYAKAILELLDKASISRNRVLAVGVHGQTIRHRPKEGWSLQLNNPALIAELTGLDVVCDFRARDLAAGGEGAPLVPAFHKALFASKQACAVVNIGGIANVTLLPPERSFANLIGYDCGPGNVLMDAWCKHHTGEDFDKDGQWASSGTVDKALLMRLRMHPYFAKKAPKSTGREDFNEAWLTKNISDVKPEDVQATLAMLTAQTIVDAIKNAPYEINEIYLCGGGALNKHLVSLIDELAGADVLVQSTKALGVDPMLVEAMAFAWLTWAFFNRTPGNLCEVTHASGTRVLGALYPH